MKYETQLQRMVRRLGRQLAKAQLGQAFLCTRLMVPMLLAYALCSAATVQAAGVGDNAPKKCSANDIEYTITNIAPEGTCALITDSIEVNFDVNMWGNPQRYNLAVGYTNAGDPVLQDVSCLSTGIDLDSAGCEDYDGSGTAASPLVAQSSFTVSCDLDGNLLLEPLIGVDFYVSFETGSGGTIPEITSPKCLLVAGNTLPLKPASLQLNKSVTNDSGGTASAPDWTLTAAQVGGTISMSGSSGVIDNNLPAGDYLLSETGPAGYTLDSVSCTGAVFNSATSTLTLQPDDVAVCSFTNNDDLVPPSTTQLTLVKTIVNDNGGSTVVEDFDISINGTEVVSGVAAIVNPGINLVISELDLTPYNEGTWNCIDNNLVTPSLPTSGVATNTVLNLLPGSDVVCSIENNDKGVDLSVIKTVSNSAPSIGDNIQFTLTLNNGGPDVATGVLVSDIVPSGFTYVVGSISGGDTMSDADPAGAGLTWTVSSIAPAGVVVLQFNATVQSP